MSKSKRIVAPFTNKFGQTIQPGEDVFAITTCTGIVSINQAKYVGYVERQSYDWDTKTYGLEKFAQISTPCTKNVYYKKGTTEPFVWGFYNSGIPGTDQFDRVEVPFDQISTLQYNRIIPTTASLNDMASIL